MPYDALLKLDFSSAGTSIVKNVRSPWWYRRRDLVIAALFIAAFAAGDGVWQAFTGSSDPLFVLAWKQYGRDAATLLLALAALAALACWAVRSWGAAYLTTSVVWDERIHDDRLIIAGPFRYVRNPLYFGNVLLAVAVAVFGTPLAAVLIIIMQTAFLMVLGRRESQALERRFGAAFGTYARAVPELFPRLMPYGAGSAGPIRIRFLDGARSEWLTGGFALGFIAITIAPQHQTLWFWLPSLIGIAIQMSAKYRRRTKAGRRPFP